MRRFRFPLAPLARLLGYRERQAELRAAQAALERQRAAGLLAHLRGLMAATQDEQRKARTARSLDPREQASYDAYFQAMDHAAATQERKLAKAEKRLEKRNSELREARVKKRVVEVLRERRLAEHRRLALRELARILDEAGARLTNGPGPRGPSPAI